MLITGVASNYFVGIPHIKCPNRYLKYEICILINHTHLSDHPKLCKSKKEDVACISFTSEIDFLPVKHFAYLDLLTLYGQIE